MHHRIQQFSFGLLFAVAVGFGAGCADDADDDASGSGGAQSSGNGMNDDKLGAEECEAYCAASLERCVPPEMYDRDACVSTCRVGPWAYGQTCADVYQALADCLEPVSCDDLGDACEAEKAALSACAPPSE